MSKRIPLTQGKFAIVDDDDYEWLMHYTWSFNVVRNRRTVGYARTTVKRADRHKTVMMHRLILEAPPGKQVDHINGNGLDNRRANLRLATASQQQQNRALGKNNTSGYKGVGWWPRQRRWHASIQYHGEIIHLGYFKSKEAAARAYDRAARKYFGEFAYTNFD